jgi:hypothetical protein
VKIDRIRKSGAHTEKNKKQKDERFLIIVQPPHCCRALPCGFSSEAAVSDQMIVTLDCVLITSRSR